MLFALVYVKRAASAWRLSMSSRFHGFGRDVLSVGAGRPETSNQRQDVMQLGSVQPGRTARLDSLVRTH